MEEVSLQNRTGIRSSAGFYSQQQHNSSADSSMTNSLQPNVSIDR